jgi:CPA2 family monovalent cation:H+ antiporter-2
VRKQNAGAVIIARAHSDEEEAHLLHLGANTVILGEREIGMGMLELVNRDSTAVAEITAADAVAAALGTAIASPRPPAATAPEPAADPEVLLEQIEAAPVQHADVGPAEPPALVSAYGEEPDQPAAPPPDSLPYKARQPARTAATPFNPEVPPPDPAKN